MALSGKAWIAHLSDELAGQRRVLERLVDVVEADAAVRWLIVGCSLARGAADRFSDLDLAAGIDDAGFEATTDRIRDSTARLGDLVAAFTHALPGVPAPHARIFAQYRDRTQVDLVVAPASRCRFPRGAVALYDPEGRLDLDAPTVAAGASEVAEWANLTCSALADAGKYLRRQSCWEALARLDEARDHLWRIIAAANGVPDARYGVTSLLDFAPDRLPPSLEATVADLRPDRLLAASRHLAGLLAAAGTDLPGRLAAGFPHQFVEFVIADLEALDGPRT